MLGVMLLTVVLVQAAAIAVVTEAPTFSTPAPSPGGSSQTLNASDGAALGDAVAVSGSVALVGGTSADMGAGAVYAFTKIDASWQETAKLTASDAGGVDAFGSSVAIDGDLAIIGARFDDIDTTYANANSGSAYVFKTLDGGETWTEIVKLTATDEAPGEQFGNSVGISGSLVIVGAPFDDGAVAARSGSAFIFQTLDGGASWAEVAKLTASDADADDAFGWSVAISGNLAIVGARWDDDGGTEAGAAYVFTTPDGGATWMETDKLRASDGTVGDNFGWSVAIDGNLAVVGAPFQNLTVGVELGAAYVFQTLDGGTTWAQVQKFVDDSADGDRLGRSVAISGTRVIVGAIVQPPGVAYVFQTFDGGATWAQVDKLSPSQGGVCTNFGSSVAISGTSAVVGARQSHAYAFDLL